MFPFLCDLATARELTFTTDGCVVADANGIDTSDIPPENLYGSAACALPSRYIHLENFPSEECCEEEIDDDPEDGPDQVPTQVSYQLEDDDGPARIDPRRIVVTPRPEKANVCESPKVDDPEEPEPTFVRWLGKPNRTAGLSRRYRSARHVS